MGILQAKKACYITKAGQRYPCIVRQGIFLLGNGVSSGTRKAPAYLDLSSAFEAEKRGSDKDNIATQIKCSNAAKGMALNWLKPGSIPGRVTPVVRYVGTVPDYAAGRRISSGISSFPPLFNYGATPYSPRSPLSALKTSLLGVAQISSLILLSHTRGRDGHQRLTACLNPIPSITATRQASRKYVHYNNIHVFPLQDAMGQELMQLPLIMYCRKILDLGASVHDKNSHLQPDLTGKFLFSCKMRTISAEHGRKRGIKGFQFPCAPPHILFRNLYAQEPHPGTSVAQWLAHSPPTTVIWIRSPAGSLPDFRMWELCWTMPLAGVFSRGTPASPALAFQRRSILGFHFMSCPGMTGTYGYQLESPSLGERCLVLGSLPTQKRTGFNPRPGHSEFWKWESCRMMPLVGGFSRGSPVSPGLAFRHYSMPSLHPHWRSNLFPPSQIFCHEKKYYQGKKNE
ncbi:hypothetical protein PR048_002255 [Dryococelus australis]|uniref:Uncharacterized protein n=1 Tax=Dryococelus australis TaxID=614101 RepID=A0ABQ9IJS8_9NEOP|nr:hypothetical protein PR048_002255 [Dryococelus australis]